MGQTCDRVRFGKRTAEGSCWWEHGPCDSYLEDQEFDIFKMTAAAPTYTGTFSDTIFVMEMQGRECVTRGTEADPSSGTTASTQVALGTFGTVQECFTACERAASDAGPG